MRVQIKRKIVKKGKDDKQNERTKMKAKRAKFAGEMTNSGENMQKIHINDLQPHILGLIFSNLTPIDRLCSEKVCRLWRNVNILGFGWANQATISYEVLFGNNEKRLESKPEMTNKHIEVILKRVNRHLKKLDLSAFPSNDNFNYSICASFTHIRNLNTLDLSYIRLTNSSLSSIGRNLPKLKKASFRHSFKNTLMERGLSTLFSNCQHLEYLDVSENEHLSGTSFSDIPRTLLTLNISSCFRIKTEAIRGIQKNCQSLQKLILHQFDTVSTIHLNDMFKSLKNLTSLHFSECFSTEFYDGQPSLISLGELPKLKELYLLDNLLVNNDVVRAISLGCKSLEILNLALSSRHVTEIGLQNLSNLPNLIELNLSNQRSLTDDNLIQIVSRGKLKSLVVSRCPQITDISVLHVIKICKNLKILDIEYCTAVTSVIFKELDKLMALRHGKSQPTDNDDNQKLRLSIYRSGVQVPAKYSPWINVVNRYDVFNSSATYLLAQIPDAWTFSYWVKKLYIDDTYEFIIFESSCQWHRKMCRSKH